MNPTPDHTLDTNLNDITIDVITFLTEPGSDFGTQPDDVESLRAPDTLAKQLRLRLEIPVQVSTRIPAIGSTVGTDINRSGDNSQSGDEEPERQRLRERLLNSDLSTVDWPHVLQELRTRLRLTDGFFAQDLPSQEHNS